MREEICAALAGLLLCTALPTAAALQCRKRVPAEVPTEEPTTVAVFNITAETETEVSVTNTNATPIKRSFDNSFNLPVLLDENIDSMTLHDYLVGALVGEMPLNFDIEALKAQAIACRTYALRQYASRKHDPAAVCTASSCCECWKASDGVETVYRQKAEQAVTETDGLVLTYDGTLIEATFFSCAGGRTENAADVWGNAIPYLVSVDSPGEEKAPHYSGEVTVSLDEFCEKVQAQTDATLPTQFTETDIILISTEGGGVKSLQIGDAVISGKQLRKLFGLNSTCFALAVSGQTVTFTTTGYGHRVGMSQYGAQSMATDGADCEAILLHYYTGVTLTDCRSLYP